MPFLFILIFFVSSSLDLDGAQSLKELAAKSIITNFDNLKKGLANLPAELNEFISILILRQIEQLPKELNLDGIFEVSSKKAKLGRDYLKKLFYFFDTELLQFDKKDFQAIVKHAALLAEIEIFKQAIQRVNDKEFFLSFENQKSILEFFVSDNKKMFVEEILKHNIKFEESELDSALKCVPPMKVVGDHIIAVLIRHKINEIRKVQGKTEIDPAPNKKAAEDYWRLLLHAYRIAHL